MGEWRENFCAINFQWHLLHEPYSSNDSLHYGNVLFFSFWFWCNCFYSKYVYGYLKSSVVHFFLCKCLLLHRTHNQLHFVFCSALNAQTMKLFNLSICIFQCTSVSHESYFGFWVFNERSSLGNKISVEKKKWHRSVVKLLPVANPTSI